MRVCKRLGHLKPDASHASVVVEVGLRGEVGMTLKDIRSRTGGTSGQPTPGAVRLRTWCGGVAEVRWWLQVPACLLQRFHFELAGQQATRQVAGQARPRPCR